MGSSQSSPPADTRVRYPLGLPAGSVRALLTLTVTGYIVYQIAIGEPIGLLWNETLMIVLAHYFTSRRVIQIPPAIREQMAADGTLPTERNPLFLPKHSIRTLIVLAFAGLAVYLYREQRLFNPASLSILGTVAAYLLGMLAKSVLSWWRSDRPQTSARWWEDLKAIVTLAIVMGSVAIELTGTAASLPIPKEQLQNIALGVVLFYFGSR